MNDLVFDFQRAKEIQKQQGRTTRWLADQAGVAFSTMRSVLCGCKKASRRVVRLLAIALDVPEKELWKKAG